MEDHDHPNYIPFGDGPSLCQFKVGNDNHKIPTFARFVDQHNQKFNIDMDSLKEAEIREYPSVLAYSVILSNTVFSQKLKINFCEVSIIRLKC